MLLSITRVTSAISRDDIRLSQGEAPEGSIVLPNSEGQEGINSILVLIQDVLLKVVLPVLLVGVAIYTAYELFTAE